MSNEEKSYKAREKMGKLSFGERERECEDGGEVTEENVWRQKQK